MINKKKKEILKNRINKSDKKQGILKKDNKDILINNYIKAAGVVTQACKWSNISRETFYAWLEQDKKFKNDIDTAEEIIRDNIEGLFVSNDLYNPKKFEARKYWLDRRHPKYMPKKEVAVRGTLTHLIEEIEEKEDPIIKEDE